MKLNETLNIKTKLNELDTQAFINDEHCYDLLSLYESQEFNKNDKKILAENVI